MSMINDICIIVNNLTIYMLSWKRYKKQKATPITHGTAFHLNDFIRQAVLQVP